MNTTTFHYHACASLSEQDVLCLLPRLAALPAEYPVQMWEARREEWIEGVSRYVHPIEARLAVIEDELRDPFMDKATAFRLLDEMAELTIELEKE